MKTNLVVFLAVAACTGGSSESNNALENQAEHVNGCCKLEGGEIGQEAVLVRLGSKTVLVHDWIGKTGSRGEYVGFSLTVGGGAPISYVVKASTQKYPGTSTTWIHPNGADGGSASPGISNLDFCNECDNPDGCSGGGTGPTPSPTPSSPPCDNPDGCEGGGPVLL